MVAADMPMAKVSRPERHQGIGDHRLLNEPMEKKVMPVMIVEAWMVAGSPRTKGSNGIDPQTMKARKVINAAFPGERLIGGRPCSSVIMVSIQRPFSSVMTLTALSSASPSKPLA